MNAAQGPGQSDLDAAAEHAARVEALRLHYDSLLSEVLSQRELADLLGVGRHKIGAILRRMPGAEKWPGGWRVPIRRLPPAYHRAAGLLPGER